jgi:quercetin dioxygenase-like cupin family protein
MKPPKTAPRRKPSNPLAGAIDDDIVAALLMSVPAKAPAAKRRTAMKEALLARVAALQPTFKKAPLRAPEGAWHSVAPAIQIQTLFDNGHTLARLVRLAAGGVIPGHRHDHDEAAWVLEGSCRVGEAFLTAGDYYMVPAGAAHADIVSAHGCVLLINGPSQGNIRRSDTPAATGR